jgi:hypothetical protein
MYRHEKRRYAASDSHAPIPSAATGGKQLKEDILSADSWGNDYQKGGSDERFFYPESRSRG